MEIPQSPVCFICQHKFRKGDNDDIVSIVKMRGVSPEGKAAAPAGSVCHVGDDNFAVLVCRNCKGLAGVVFGLKTTEPEPEPAPVNSAVEMKVGAGKTRTLTAGRSRT